MHDAYGLIFDCTGFRCVCLWFQVTNNLFDNILAIVVEKNVTGQWLLWQKLSV
jgi:hypothetical protein